MQSIDDRPVRSLDNYPHNLPIQLTRLVGRENEIREIGKLLVTGQPITLTGAGGVGKTRLGLAVAASLVDRFTSGTWWADLSALSEPSALASVLLAACSTHEVPGRKPFESLLTHLASGPTLLVLDNCEHLLDAVAPIVTELACRCAGLHVLATSREPLGASGEVSWRVPSLAVPDLETAPEPEQIAKLSSVQMFVAAASRARPTFRLESSNATAVAQICRRLDGIPLALELAAARCRQLDPTRIADELDDHFRLLTGGNRSGLARHRTLGASVDWSHDRLDEVERKVLRRLGVFAGTFSLDAAEFVASSVGDLERAAVFDATIRLVDRSLVMTEEADGESGFRLLESIRQFAVAKASEAGELTALRNAHADWWTTWLEEIGADDATDANLAEVRSHYEDCRAALSWLLPEPSSAARLVRCLWPVWMHYRSDDATGLAGQAESTADAGSLERATIATFRYFAIAVAGGQPPLDIAAAFDRVAKDGPGDDRVQAVRMRWNLLDGLDPREIPLVSELVRSSGHNWTRQAFEGTAGITQLLVGHADDAADRLDRVDVRNISAARVLLSHARIVSWVVRGEPPAGGRPVGIEERLVDPMTSSVAALGRAMAGVLRRDFEQADLAVTDLERLAKRTPLAESFLACGRAAYGMATGKATPSPKVDQLFGAVRVIRVEQAQVLILAMLHHHDTAELSGFVELLDSPVETAYVNVLKSLHEGTVAAMSGDARVAEQYWYPALALAAEHGYRLLLVDLFEGLAHLAAATSAGAQAPLMLAAARQLRLETGYCFRREPFASWVSELPAETATRPRPGVVDTKTLTGTAGWRWRVLCCERAASGVVHASVGRVLHRPSWRWSCLSARGGAIRRSRPDS